MRILQIDKLNLNVEYKKNIDLSFINGLYICL